MKKWNAAEIVELKITETAHEWLGNSWDGGYIGDGQVSGHLEFDCSNGEGNNNNNNGNGGSGDTDLIS